MILKTSNKRRAADSPLPERAGGEIDTSLLLEELSREYQRTGQHVEVDFRKLVGWVRLGDQLTHQIHPYPAKLLPNIAHFFLRASVLHNPTRCVLDPFCGSGTVALEASMAGYTPYVADANPLALLITKVKTTPYDPEGLNISTKKIIARAARFRTAPEIPVVNHHLWYAPERKKGLEILLRAIMEIDDETQRDFFRICFSVTARRLSLSDPAVSVPVRLKTRDTFGKTTNEKIKSRLDWIANASPTAEFAKVCESNIRRVLESNNLLKNRISAVPVGVDARKLYQLTSNKSDRLQCDSVPLIVTSPPYGSAQKYIRATSLSLNWLGLAAPEGLTSLESESIGREHVPLFRQVSTSMRLPDEYEQLLEKVGNKNPKRALITRHYLFEMKSALCEMARVTSKGGHIVLVVGNNLVCGEPLRNDKYVVHVLQELGLNLELSLIDHIKSRGLMTKRNKTASVISLESVLVFSKK
jgi:tRNA G10  N-methylase Trm11